MKKYWVIIPAAGIGARFQTEKPKQYLSLQGKAVLEHSIALFLQQTWVEKIIVSLSAHDSIFDHLPIAKHPKIQVVTGGLTRAHSVMNGLVSIKECTPEDWVLTHDAVRPCLTQFDLDALKNKLAQDPFGGILATPVQDTVKLVSSDTILRTIDRQNLWQASTPQMFRLALLKKALLHCFNLGIEVTDDASAMEHCGYSVKVVEAKDPNPKLTYLRDVHAISMILKKDVKELIYD